MSSSVSSRLPTGLHPHPARVLQHDLITRDAFYPLQEFDSEIPVTECLDLQHYGRQAHASLMPMGDVLDDFQVASIFFNPNHSERNIRLKTSSYWEKHFGER